MNPRAVLLLLLFAATPSVRYFHYYRLILHTPQQAQQTCVTLDPATFIHAGSDLASLRLYNGRIETPYVINKAAPLQATPQNISLLNLGLRNGRTSFDAAMPEGSYSDLDLAVNATNFIATVRVTGNQTQSGPTTSLGFYNIFDFTQQKLGRSTILHLPLSDFRYLHLAIDGPIRPDQITGLSTERISAAAPQYVNVSVTASVLQQGRDSVITFEVPPNVPVDRIVVAPGQRPSNFSRDVTVTVEPILRSSGDGSTPQSVNAYGNLLRLHTISNGHKIDEERLAIDAPVYAPAFAADGTTWTITVHNHDDAPIDIRSVALQMIVRNLCFDATPGAVYFLYYGDPALSPPRYDYAALFTPDKNAAHASLGPSLLNPQYEPRPDTRPLTEKHPVLLWIALLIAISLLGMIAFRSAKRLRQP